MYKRQSYASAAGCHSTALRRSPGNDFNCSKHHRHKIPDGGADRPRAVRWILPSDTRQIVADECIGEARNKA